MREFQRGSPEAAHLERLTQRMLYLGLRVRIKGELGWENVHDAAEQAAIRWALDVLTGIQPLDTGAE